MIKKTKTYNYGDVSFTVDPKKARVVVKIGELKATVKKDDIWQMAFLFSKEDKQDELIPVRERPMMQFDRIHTITATKDIKQGETIKFHCHVDVPLMVVDQLLEEQGKTLEDVIPAKDIVIPLSLEKETKE